MPVLDDQGFPNSGCAAQCCHTLAQLEHVVDTQVNTKLAVPVGFAYIPLSPMLKHLNPTVEFMTKLANSVD